MMTAAPIALTDVSVYPDGDRARTPILNKLNVHIAQGEWISVVGANGSGKSTLARVLAGIQPVHDGAVQRGFARIEPIPYVMQQDNQWFGDTPREELVFWLETRGEPAEQIPGRVDAALAAVGLADEADRPLRQLSGGQRQLVAAAGCLAAQAPLLLFDEATAHLDAGARRHVLAAARAIHDAGTAVLWLTHHQEEAAAGERILALQDGKVVYDGPAAAFYYGADSAKSEADLLEGKAEPVAVKLPPCDRFGFEPPYVVQIVRELARSGIRFERAPLTAEQLAEAVSLS